MIQVNRIYLIFNRLVTKKFLVDTSDSFVIITEQSWCKMSFFWKSKNFSSFLSIQYQMDFCKFGVNLIGREKITQLIL